MGRRVDIERLVGVQEIATRAGLGNAHLVHDWRRRYPDDFPAPILALNMGLVWDWREVEQWLKRTGRLG